MICPACRHENPEASKFCLGCGAGLELHCRHCEAELPAGSSFCNQCGGAQADDTQAAAGDSAPEHSPHDYTPKHIADKILSQKSAMEGERKQVSVLFADVKSSLDLQQDLDPEEWHGIMDRFFQILADSIHRFEGTVNQYTGDGIMARCSVRPSPTKTTPNAPATRHSTSRTRCANTRANCDASAVSIF